MSEPRPHGPNVKRLIARFMSKIAIPDGGGLADGIAFLTNRERISDVAKQATYLTFESIDAVKATHDNPYGNDDEAIAGAVLQKIEEENTRRIIEKAKA